MCCGMSCLLKTMTSCNYLQNRRRVRMEMQKQQIANDLSESIDFHYRSSHPCAVGCDVWVDGALCPRQNDQTNNKNGAKKKYTDSFRRFVQRFFSFPPFREAAGGTSFILHSHYYLFITHFYFSMQYNSLQCQQ